MPDSNSLFYISLFIGFLSFAVYINVRPYKKANSLIEKWAKENNYKIIKKEKRIGLETGPFIYGGFIAIHKIVINDKEGNTRVIWSKTGQYFWPFSDRFISKYDY